MSTKSKKEGGGDWMVPFSRIKLLCWFAADADGLRERRDSLGLSLRDVVDRMRDCGYNTTHNSLHKLESGKAKSITPQMLLAIADALEVNVDEIIPSLFVKGSIDISNSFRKIK